MSFNTEYLRIHFFLIAKDKTDHRLDVVVFVFTKETQVLSMLLKVAHHCCHRITKGFARTERVLQIPAKRREDSEMSGVVIPK